MGSKSTTKDFPGFGNLYWLTEPGVAQHFRAKLLLTVNAFRVTRGEDTPEQPVRARWMMGRAIPGDWLWTGHVALSLLSDRLASILHERNISGWSTYKVNLIGKKGETIPGYSGLVVRGRCGPIDDARSLRIPKQFPAKASTVLKGFFFDPTTWDGSDFFMPEGKSGWIYVTETVKQVFESENVGNTVFIPLDEVERSVPS